MKRNLLKILFIGICALSCSVAYAQDKLLYYMQQREKTEQVLQQYLNKLLAKNNIQPDRLDEIYVNFIPPMGCPRCEGVIIEYNKQLLKKNPTAFLVNILLYEKEKAVSEYIKKQNFQGKVLVVDTTNLFPQIFHVNNKNAQVPYITKISLQKGRVIAATASLGAELDENFINNIIRKNDFELLYNQSYNPPEEQPVNISLHLNKWQDVFDSKLFLMPYDSCKIIAADTLPTVEKFAVSPDGNYLFVDNFLTNSFVLYSKNKDKWTSPVLLQPSDEEDMMFVNPDISSQIYDYLKTSNILVSMYLKANFTKQNIYVLGSLPNLDMILKIDTVSKDTIASLAYFNMPVCIVKDRLGKTVSLLKLNVQNLTETDYVYSHSSGVFFEEDNIFVYQMQKGWPVAGSESQPQNSEKNPFLLNFYNGALTLCFYDIKNQRTTATAPLDDIYKKYKLGYYVSTPLIKKQQNNYYWTDKFLGKIYVLANDLKSSVRICDLFGMDSILQAMPYSEDLKYLESYQPFFNREVIDFEVSENNESKALVFSGGHYYLYQTKNRKIDIIPFPDTINGMKNSGMQFGHNSQNNLVVYGLYQNHRDIVVYYFIFC
jgi:hypothetical protein